MGLIYSKADGGTEPPPMPNFASIGAAASAALKREKPNYLELPQPVRYEEIQRENIMVLKPDTFEGMRFEINKPLNPYFFLSHALYMGNLDLSTGSKQMLKTSVGTYEFGANVINEKYMLLGRLSNDGRLSGRVKYDFTNWLSSKVQLQLGTEPGQSHAMADADFKGSDWNAQLKVGTPSFLGLNYFQSVTPNLSAGGELFWLQTNMKSGVGLALRHQGDNGRHVSTAQVASTGVMNLQYSHKVTDKVTLATDLLWHWGTRDACATVGYDAILRQCRLRGKIDTNGVATAYLEERFSPGINFVMSAELDHFHNNYKFGFGVVAGE
ncbi:40 kDa translocon at mitochondrial outer envelope membrane [Dunaliella salina]|uniref:40 kDa translocon at mitochondrial outer envelope membrane n=1 Tax=Dunaliella salina TaxID=3046 RepID=A0ABQ7GJT7_DUNSA|nr:40 kDa translocon at mitochondrial outer envelope membrane [Dunaliella salina]|eukprot:KAF5834850.1 40 kDa translocon at mitochondrial outer envelope membrane [Dunaliella salina]